MSLSARFIASISDVPASRWNALAGNEYPFHRHEFLIALEESGCIGGDTGWSPLHLLLEQDDTLVAALPMYQKTNSEGEFIFDFAWARAYHQAGLEYFPKLVAAIPFTPVNCNCILLSESLDTAEKQHEARAQLLSVVINQMKEHDISSLHMLFPTEDEQKDFADIGLLMRRDCQFHWANNNYKDFDDFLATFSAKKRKKVKRERRKVAEAGISYKLYEGHELTDDLWDRLTPLYSRTFLLRGRMPYLNTEFFRQVTRTLPEALMVIVAYKDDQPIATAICFKAANALYGRYWGADGDYDSLHFETCYYQGIDYCIRNGLQLFEPGTQGEHKIARGFSPTRTGSAHWISDERFAAAIDSYLKEEGEHIDAYMESLASHVPYKDKPQKREPGELKFPEIESD